jgi:hypothetical protein
MRLLRADFSVGMFDEKKIASQAIKTCDAIVPTKMGITGPAQGLGWTVQPAQMIEGLPVGPQAAVLRRWSAAYPRPGSHFAVPIDRTGCCWSPHRMAKAEAPQATASTLPEPGLQPMGQRRPAELGPDWSGLNPHSSLQTRHWMQSGCSLRHLQFGLRWSWRHYLGSRQ